MDQETVSMLAHKARHKIDFLNQKIGRAHV